ncbi:hypothetical protein GCM10007108_12690 [Thermogymnomonas acidicola]|uniref:Uncharacterized protein n=1 Tax=Thermogymnomonas acidicola TaxID=399579 RepID=A0AA37BRV0_9ARCH|nr:hypothetical protein [Thermogymnomonas acidicola]GGM76178.1 hypothetical protein GCM10007108_12690 [Thermogymnomonas acidicola]
MLSRQALQSIQKGARVVVYPFSEKYGDDFTTPALECFGSPLSASSLIELVQEPTEAYFLDFDGYYIRLQTAEHWCIRVPVEAIRDIRLVA